MTDVPGRFSAIKHDVILKTEVPAAKTTYMLPYALHEKVKSEFDGMLEAGIIAEKCNSPYAGPIVIVPKKGGCIRLYVDYGLLNQITVFDPQQMPRLKYIINKFDKAKYQSKLDLTKEVWQIPLTDRSQEARPFVTPFGHCRFIVMPFGIVNLSATFVRLMKMVLSQCEEFADSFIDDAIIFSEPWLNHVFHQRSTTRSFEFSLTAKPSKCMFCFKEIEF